MGLEGVEIVMAVEEEFGILITDEEAARVKTVGELADLAVRKRSLVEGDCPTARNFYRFRKILMTEFGISRAQVRPSTAVKEIIPRAGRRRAWKVLEERFGLRLPGLRRPFVVRAVILTVATGAGLAMVSRNGGAVATEIDGVVGLGFGCTCAAFLLFLTRPLQSVIPERVRTVGNLVSQAVSVSRPAVATKPAIEPESARGLVRKIVAEQLGRRVEDVLPESRFIEDLGV